jgi:hypothetical protein
MSGRREHVVNSVGPADSRSILASNGTQLAVGTSKAIVVNAGTTVLYITFSGHKIKITRAKVETKEAFIYNSAAHGESQETIVFDKECGVAILNNRQEYIPQPGCKVAEPNNDHPSFRWALVPH